MVLMCVTLPMLRVLHYQCYVCYITNVTCVTLPMLRVLHYQIPMLRVLHYQIPMLRLLHYQCEIAGLNVTCVARLYWIISSLSNRDKKCFDFHSNIVPNHTLHYSLGGMGSPYVSPGANPKFGAGDFSYGGQPPVKVGIPLRF